MQTDYHIEDLVHQTADLVVYRVVTREQISMALVRLRYDAKTLDRLKDGMFQNALTQLQQLNHNCLRPVVDGGLDPVDGSPWIVAQWWDGILIPDRVRDSDLTAEEFNRIKFHGESLIAALGEFAGAVSFTPGSVVICGGGEQTIDTFSIDYHNWFAAFAWGVHPATTDEPLQRFNALLTYLIRNTEHISTPTTPRETSPTQATSLASTNSSSFPLTIVLFLAALLAGIAFFSWKFINRTPTEVVETETEINLPTKKPDPAKPSPAESSDPPLEIPPTKRPGNREAFVQVDPTALDSLDGKIGQWITFECKFSSLDDKGLLHVSDSSIKVALPPGSGDLARPALRNKVKLWGFLSSASLLRIVNPDDLEITYLPQEFYTIDDERQIRKTLLGTGQIIPVRAVVTELSQSGSGKTLYLQFKETVPEFAAAVEIKKAESSLDRPFLQSLVGKEIQVRGRPEEDTLGGRLSIVVTKKSQITVIK